MIDDDEAYGLRCDIGRLEQENATLRQQLEDITVSMGRLEERHAKTFEVGKRWMAKAARFEAENAKLLEIIADLEEMLPKSERWYIHKTANAIADDNAKLRELVRDMYHVIATLEEANDEAVVRGGVMLDAAHFAKRMHELGVEVES